MLRDSFWPNGKWIGDWEERTPEQKRKTRQEAEAKLLRLIPGKTNSNYVFNPHFHSFFNHDFFLLLFTSILHN